MESTEKRTIHSSRRFAHPVETVWEMWSDPSHLAHWWGPAGFTNTIDLYDFQKGGEWKMTMHGPDGTNFPNRAVFLEIETHKKIVFEHFNPHFITTVIFKDLGSETHIDWSLLFDTAEMRDIVVHAHNAEKGQEENFDKLESYLAKQ